MFVSLDDQDMYYVTDGCYGELYLLCKYRYIKKICNI